jgi:hypothetical protein
MTIQIRTQIWPDSVILPGTLKTQLHFNLLYFSWNTLVSGHINLTVCLSRDNTTKVRAVLLLAEMFCTFLQTAWMQTSIQFRSYSQHRHIHLSTRLWRHVTPVVPINFSPIPVAARSKAWGLGLLACWDCGFETRRGHGCLFLVSVVCCWVEMSATGRSIVQRSPSERGVSEWSRSLDNEEA